MSSMIILPPVVLMVSLFRRLDFLRTSFHPFFHKGQSQVERVQAALTRYSPNIFAASHTVLSKVIQEASDKGLVKLPEKSFQRPPNANDAPEGWPAYCYFIGWLFTLLCIAGRIHFTLSSCFRDHFLHKWPRKIASGKKLPERKKNFLYQVEWVSLHFME